MSCGLAVAAILLMSDPAVTAPPVVPPNALAQEPMYADIISRSQALKAVVEGWITSDAAQDSGFAGRPDFVAFREAATQLSERDMAGHLDLRARGTDGDLRCILRGLSEDLPRRVEDVAAATTPATRGDALAELGYLLNDNIAVIVAPPAPQTGEPPH
ncbi:MAG TPA: hypothetical protein PLE81_02120 [Brevundimonas sp.]|jgi:hypothetical protein|uniref:hypothetical protein n=1 Tax=Brevundimonas sp. TaxID=1871086 RepID=UPI002C1D48E3|nr:hypothetical protein [Brevundimonas sp.]HRH19409.1 hypothetical protein [Brevundimonas sp.]